MLIIYILSSICSGLVFPGDFAKEAEHGRLVPQKVSMALQWEKPPTPAEVHQFDVYDYMII